MPRLHINTNDIQSAFTPIEPGKYLAKLVDCQEGDSSKGNPMWTWTWEILEGPGKGREIKSYTVLVDQALFGLKAHLEAFGIVGDYNVDTDKLIGKKVRLVIGNRKFKDRETGEDRISSNVVTVMAATTTKAAVQQAAPAQAAKAPAKVAAPEEQPDGDEDEGEEGEEQASGGIPF